MERIEFDSSQIAYLRKAIITDSFLTQTTYLDSFSALVELVDNSYDAMAKEVHININADEDFLEVVDDGIGMTREEALKIAAYGHSKKSEKEVGRFGLGLKYGSFHLGNELLVLTKRNQKCTALLISKSMLECHKRVTDNAILLACCSFELNGKPIVEPGEERNHKAAMSMLWTYGKFDTPTLKKAFDSIKEHGTIVRIMELKKKQHVDVLPFDVLSKAKDHDITMDEIAEAYKRSLRYYLSILYLEPRMKIYLQGTLVQPKHVSESWMFKQTQMIGGKEIMRQNEEVLERAEKIRAAKIRNQEESVNVRDVPLNRASLQANRLEIDRIQEMKNQEIESTAAARRKFKDTSMIMMLGLEIRNREHDGLFFYINNRLIEGSSAPDQKPTGTGRKFRKKSGISGYISLDYSLYKPATDKQKFDSANITPLKKKMWEHMATYCALLENNLIPDHLEKFFEVENAHELSNDEVWEKFNSVYGYSGTLRNMVPRFPQNDPLKEAREKALSRETRRWYLCKFCRYWNYWKAKVLPVDEDCRSCGNSCNRSRTENHEKLTAPKKKPIPQQPSSSSVTSEAKPPTFSIQNTRSSLARLAPQPTDMKVDLDAPSGRMTATSSALPRPSPAPVRTVRFALPSPSTSTSSASSSKRKEAFIASDDSEDDYEVETKRKCKQRGREKPAEKLSRRSAKTEEVEIIEDDDETATYSDSDVEQKSRTSRSSSKPHRNEVGSNGQSSSSTRSLPEKGDYKRLAEMFCAELNKVNEILGSDAVQDSTRPLQINVAAALKKKMDEMRRDEGVRDGEQKRLKAFEQVSVRVISCLSNHRNYQVKIDNENSRSNALTNMRTLADLLNRN
ncbi:unnamed protein product [Caenorhabditis sp. 36 PRJEB53466]|nr:unnamed protein product [Caenorhabditis sp. 36 PRJEB53466]